MKKEIGLTPKQKSEKLLELQELRTDAGLLEFEQKKLDKLLKKLEKVKTEIDNQEKIIELFDKTGMAESITEKFVEFLEGKGFYPNKTSYSTDIEDIKRDGIYINMDYDNWYAKNNYVGESASNYKGTIGEYKGLKIVACTKESGEDSSMDSAEVKELLNNFEDWLKKQK